MHPSQVLSTSVLQPQISGSLRMWRKTSALIKPCVCTGFVHAPESITPFPTITNFQIMNLTMAISKILFSSYFPFWTKGLFFCGKSLCLVGLITESWAGQGRKSE